MTIEVQRPELEALIDAWMRSGAFGSVEEALLQALRTAQLPRQDAVMARDANPTRTGSDIVAAFQASPLKDVELEPARFPMPVRAVVL